MVVYWEARGAKKVRWPMCSVGSFVRELQAVGVTSSARQALL